MVDRLEEHTDTRPGGDAELAGIVEKAVAADRAGRAARATSLVRPGPVIADGSSGGAIPTDCYMAHVVAVTCQIPDSATHVTATIRAVWKKDHSSNYLDIIVAGNVSLPLVRFELHITDSTVDLSPS